MHTMTYPDRLLINPHMRVVIRLFFGSTEINGKINKK